MKSALRWISAALVAAGVSAAWSSHAFADVKIGVTVSATGPAASLGIPEKNTIALLPKEVAGQKVDYIVLDDATDSTQAVKNARKLTSEDHVDALIGSTVVPNSLAMMDVAVENTTPVISLAAAASIVVTREREDEEGPIALLTRQGAGKPAEPAAVARARRPIAC